MVSDSPLWVGNGPSQQVANVCRLSTRVRHFEEPPRFDPCLAFLHRRPASLPSAGIARQKYVLGRLTRVVRIPGSSCPLPPSGTLPPSPRSPRDAGSDFSDTPQRHCPMPRTRAYADAIPIGQPALAQATDGPLATGKGRSLGSAIQPGRDFFDFSMPWDDIRWKPRPPPAC